MATAAVIVAAGQGQRFGNAGKSFAAVLGRPMAWWSLQAALGAASIDEIVLVCGIHSQNEAGELLRGMEVPKPVSMVLGGSRRQDSALAGLEATSAAVDIVAIQDAARPLVTSALFDLAVASARANRAAITAVPVADTIKRVRGGRVIETLSRDDLVSVQTPQAFQKDLLLSAFAEAERTGLSVTDEAALLEATGHEVHVVPGFPENVKVTYPGDILLVEALLRTRIQ